MNWLNFLNTSPEYRHPFGRGINAKVHKDEEELFNKSYEAFEKRDTLNAYEYFFKSLENFTDHLSNKNIIISKSKDKIEFTIYQGSAKITGYLNDENLYAEATIIKKESANVALKRRILERNYQFTYAKYFTDSEFIKIKLFHDNITMSPHKVFFPLREICINADFDKEYIKSEFNNINLEDVDHLKPLDVDELHVKYNYLQSWIDELESKLLTLPSNDNVSMQSFMFLNFLFKIDYLLTPKYDIYQKITKIIQEYFGEEGIPTETKNELLKEYIDDLKEMDFDKFCTNFYNAKYTFNQTEKSSHEEIKNFINESLIKIRWYKNNRYNQIIPTIYTYISFYTLYNFGLHSVTKELLHTLIEIQNPKFFVELGYKELYNEENNSFSKKSIISRVENIISPFSNKFKSLKPFGDKLNFSSLNEFSNSFYLQIQELNFEEI
ncbi:hypothetical protein N9A28_04420 [Sulfurimonas sp.]|nr:hypothetical protein [Sulfurimonas sp.]